MPKPERASRAVRSALLRILCPDEPRAVPYRRQLLNVFRIIHILCFSIYLGGLFFDQPAAALQGWLWGAVLSGLALLTVDLYSSFIMLFEVRGVSVMLKIIALLPLPLLQSQAQLWLIAAIVVFSSYVSHSSRRLRHKNLLPRRWLRRLGMQHLAER